MTKRLSPERLEEIERTCSCGNEKCHGVYDLISHITALEEEIAELKDPEVHKILHIQDATAIIKERDLLAASLNRSKEREERLVEALRSISMGHDQRCSYQDLGCFQCVALETLAAHTRSLEEERGGG